MAKLKKNLLPGNVPSAFPPNTLSVCMIVKNEEATLAECLESVRAFADEVVIVDTGSTDRTVEIAKQYGAKVFQSDWRDDFSYSRNISLDRAASAWVLWLDADDRIDDASAAQINRLKREVLQLNTAFGFKLKNISAGGLGETCVQIRMFPNDPRIRFEKRIHEQVSYSLERLGYKILYLSEIEVRHTGYMDDAMKKKKALRNRALLEQDMKNYPNDPNYMAAFGDTFFMAEEWEKGIEAYKAVMEIPGCRERQGDIYEFMPVTIALGYSHLNRPDDSLAWVEKGLAISPKKLELLFLGGDTCYAAGDFDRAFSYYERAAEAPDQLSTMPVDTVALRSKAVMRLGNIHLKRGSPAEARRCFEKVNALHADFYDVPASIGETHLQEGNIKEALKYFSESVLRFPGLDIRGYRHLAKISRDLGRLDDAQGFLEKGLSFFSDDITLLEELKTLSRSRNDMEKYLEAGRRLNEALASRPPSPPEGA